MILLSNMTQFNQMTELWIFMLCLNGFEPPKSVSYLKHSPCFVHKNVSPEAWSKTYIVQLKAGTNPVFVPISILIKSGLPIDCTSTENQFLTNQEGYNARRTLTYMLQGAPLQTPLLGNFPPFLVRSSLASPAIPMQVIAVANKKTVPFHVPCKNCPHTPNPFYQFAPFNAPSTFTLSPPAMHYSRSKQFTLPSNLPAIYLVIPCHALLSFQAVHPLFKPPCIYFSIYIHFLPWMLLWTKRLLQLSTYIAVAMLLCVLSSVICYLHRTSHHISTTLPTATPPHTNYTTIENVVGIQKMRSLIKAL